MFNIKDVNLLGIQELVLKNHHVVRMDMYPSSNTKYQTIKVSDRYSEVLDWYAWYN